MPAPSSPYAQIQTWIQAVAQETLPPPKTSSNSTHAMRLRPRTAKLPTRHPLQESTGNQRHQHRHLKRENPQSATGYSEDKRRAMDSDKPSSPKKRGRPPKDKTAQASTPFDLSENPQLQLRPASQAPSSANSPGRTSSPTRSKKTLPDPGYIKPESALSMTDLKTCQPPVFQLDIAGARKSGPVPPAVEALYKTLKSVKHACIPPELKVRGLLTNPRRLGYLSVTSRLPTTPTPIRQRNRGIPRPTKNIFQAAPSSSRLADVCA